MSRSNLSYPLFVLVLLSGCAATPRALNQDLTTIIPQTFTFKTFPIYTNRVPRSSNYAPSGYMGDSDLALSGGYIETVHGQGPCLKVSYKASGQKGWAGLYWQDPANNWGDVPGRAGFDLRGATRLAFWARGENGGERIHEFRVGGIVGQFPDSDVATLNRVKLTKEWKRYEIDLTGKDLRHIIGGFGFFVNKADNPGGIQFYIDDIVFEGSGSIVKSTTTVSAPPPEPVLEKKKEPEVLVVPNNVPKELQVKQVDGNLKVSFSSQVLFASGKSVLTASSTKILNQLVQLLEAYPKNDVLVEGHTDSVGGAAINLNLSRLRALAVQDYLIKQGGFSAKRFRSEGYGLTRPISDNKTVAGRSLNRRVDVTILKKGE